MNYHSRLAMLSQNFEVSYLTWYSFLKINDDTIWHKYYDMSDDGEAQVRDLKCLITLS